MNYNDELTRNYFPKLNDWFKDMDEAFNKIKRSDEKSKINNVLINNDIKPID